jgi:hypothetical protein
LQETVLQCLASLGNEHYPEGMFKLVKRLDKCLNANADYLENKHLDVAFPDFIKELLQKIC